MTNDDELQKRVLDELRWDPKVESNQVGVIAKDGAVTLTGEVYTYAKNWRRKEPRNASKACEQSLPTCK